MKQVAGKNITTFEEILEKKYGKRGEKKRQKWEKALDAFLKTGLRSKKMSR